MAQIMGMALAPPEAGERSIACQPLEASTSGETGITLLRGGFTLENRAGSPVEVSLGRFSEGLPVHFGPIAPGVPTALRIPDDAAAQPWRLGLTGSGPVRLCTTG
jgi:hypothetical protein